MKTEKTKRVTISVNKDVDVIKNHIESDTGVKMTYVQTFDFLITFYLKHAQEPRTRWASLRSKDE